MVAGSPDSHLLRVIPDDAGDPCRVSGVLLQLPAAHLPHRAPIEAGEMGREGDGAEGVGRGQVTLDQGVEHGRAQMHDAHAPGRRRFGCV